jgi:predicted AAA+ superfamily ATPase
MNNTFQRTELLLDTLTVFRSLRETTVLSSFRSLLKEAGEGHIGAAAACYAAVFNALREAGFSDIGAYLNEMMKFTETPFAAAVVNETADPVYLSAAERDIGILAEAAALPCSALKRCLLGLSGGTYDELIAALPEWEAGGLISFEALTEFYRENGAGPLAKYRAFIWTGSGLEPVKSPDPIRYEKMVGYNWQRQAVLENTRALVCGKAVNNVLLYGDSGTGKSATVKAMLNFEEFGRLALIEIQKQGMTRLPELMERLSGRPQKYILFIDDLSFEPGDPNYSVLKVILEGGLGQRPENAALYVTSNRRQLVRRSFSDRDEMNAEETVQEKTSLADRFGIRLPFFALNQEEYLKTAAALLQQAGITMDDTMKTAALQWALEHSARTPRTARQFTDELAAKQK